MEKLNISQLHVAQENNGHTLSEKDSPTCFTHKQGGNGKTLLQKAIFLTVLMTSMLFGEYALAQSDFINELPRISPDDQPLDGRYIKPVGTVNGYYIAGFLASPQEAFIARVDDYGNPLWAHTMEANSDQIVLEVSNTGHAVVAYQIHNGDIEIQRFDPSGSNVGNYPQIVEADGFNPADLITTQNMNGDFALLSTSLTEEAMTVTLLDATQVQIHRRYDTPEHSKKASSAAIVQKFDSNHDPGNLLVIYGTTTRESSVAVFELDVNINIASLLKFQRLEDGMWNEPGHIDIHDVVSRFEPTIGFNGEYHYYIVGAIGEERISKPIILRLDHNNDLFYHDEFYIPNESEINHLVAIERSSTTHEFIVMGIGFSDPRRF